MGGSCNIASDCCAPAQDHLRAICTEQKTCDYVNRDKEVIGCAQAGEGLVVMGGFCG